MVHEGEMRRSDEELAAEMSRGTSAADVSDMFVVAAERSADAMEASDCGRRRTVVARAERVVLVQSV